MQKLKNVLIVNALKANLVNISQLYDQGMLVNFTKDKFFVPSKLEEKIIERHMHLTIAQGDSIVNHNNGRV